MVLDEPYRPQYHFTPAAQWMNDPNGLIYYNGEYHLFYQHNPNDTVWGPMHWGHAVSTNLVNWQHLPIALYPDEVGAIFSGTAVIDWQDSTGFGKEAMVAVFTHADGDRQMQSLAYSLDDGRSWTKHDGNPVLEPPNAIKNFRDPKVFWYENDDGSGHWVMAVAAGRIILFYSSNDLLSWESTGGFGLTQGATCGVWETPDLFELPIEDSQETRWVLAVAIGDCAPAGGSGIQYFVGDFDGQTFTNENDKDKVLWADFGSDFYAPQSWNEAPNGRRIWAGWMNNWRYAHEIPTSTWRGALTLPRELVLVQTAVGIRLRQEPIPELQTLRGESWSWENQTLTSGTAPFLDDVKGESFEIVAEFAILDPPTTDRFGFRLRTGSDEETVIGYAAKKQTLFVDRRHSGNVNFDPEFGQIHSATMFPEDGLIRLHIFVDRSSLEVFGHNGLISFTERIFPSEESVDIELFVDGGQVNLETLQIYSLESMTTLPVEPTE